MYVFAVKAFSCVVDFKALICVQFTVMSKAGINVDIFKAHSCRSAVHSKAKASFVPIDTILSTGGWASADTFSKFYDRAVVSFETGILNT